MVVSINLQNRWKIFNNRRIQLPTSVKNRKEVLRNFLEHTLDVFIFRDNFFTYL